MVSRFVGGGALTALGQAGRRAPSRWDKDKGSFLVLLCRGGVACQLYNTSMLRDMRKRGSL